MTLPVIAMKPSDLDAAVPFLRSSDRKLRSMSATLTINGVSQILPTDKPWSIVYAPPMTPKPPDGIFQRLSGRGVVCFASDSVDKATAIMRDIGVDRVRWWHSTKFQGEASGEFITPAKTWKAKGVKKIVLTATYPVGMAATDLPNIAQAKAWAKSFRAKYDGIIDALQVINECNLTKYNPGGIKHAATICVAIAEELAGSKIQVIAPSISKDINALKTLVGTGIGSKVSAMAYHAYGAQSDEHIRNCKAARDVVGETTYLVMTERGLHSGSYNGWRFELPLAHEGCKPYINEVYDYRLITKTEGEVFAGKFGYVMPDTYLPNPECYATWKGLK